MGEVSCNGAAALTKEFYSVGKKDNELPPRARFEIDLSGRILTWTLVGEDVMADSRRDALGELVTSLCPPEQTTEWLHWLARVRDLQEIAVFKTVFEYKDGSQQHALVSLSPAKNEDQDVIGYIALFQPFTENSSRAESRVERASEGATSTVGHALQHSGCGEAQRDFLPPVLLATASASGTIAAVRLLGDAGIDVGVICSERLAAASWSRYTKRSYSAPNENENCEFLSRLLAIGRASPGQVLLSTSDKTASLYSEHREELSQHFRLYQPAKSTMKRILDKRLFEDAVRRCGLPVLPSWEPRNLDEVIELSRILPYPVLIKPRSHVNRRLNNKGSVVYSKTELRREYERFINREHVLVPGYPESTESRLPILQQFVSANQEGVRSVSGFLDQSRQLFLTRCSRKVFQRSQPVGVGVCFEALPDDPGMAQAALSLCLELDYFGMFEIEFLRFQEGWAPIDFNGRLFNQIGLDIRRGMPLPLLSYLDAAGKSSALYEAVTQANRADDARTVFADLFTLRSILFARAATGRISAKELSYWRGWIQRNTGRTVDASINGKDPMPGFVHALSEIAFGVKAFPKFLRSLPRVNSSSTKSTKTAKVQL